MTDADEAREELKRRIRVMVHTRVAAMSSAPVDSLTRLAISKIPAQVEYELRAQGHRIIPPFRVVFCDEDRTVNQFFLEETH